jgi:hypothetical protein
MDKPTTMDKPTSAEKTKKTSNVKNVDVGLNDLGNGLSSEKNTMTKESKSSKSLTADADFITGVTSKAGAFESQVEGLIRKRPLTIMAGALALGFVANRLLSRKKGSIQ